MALDFDVGSAIGGIAGGIASAKAADRAVKRQIAWERERATHAHQWEVADLKAAGLNPVLSAGGSGAVTGGISAPVPDFSGINNISSSSSAASQARTAKKGQQALERLQDAQIGQIEAVKKLTDLQAANSAQELTQKKAEFNAVKGRLEAEGQYNQSGVGRALSLIGFGSKDIAPLLNALSFGIGGFAVRGGIRKATSALQGLRNAKTEQAIIKNAFPKGWKSPGFKTGERSRLSPADKWEHVPSVYRRGTNSK